MSTPLRKLRRTFPALTFPFVSEDDIPKIWGLGDPLLKREPPILTRTIQLPTPEPISMPPRISDEDLGSAPPPLLRREPLPNVVGAPPLPSWDTGEVVTREPDPYGELSPPPFQSRLANVAPPPVMMVSRGGHPVSAVGGVDELDADRQLLRTQQSERPRRESKKMIALRTGLGFLFGGIPGAVQTFAGDVMDRRALDRGRINQNISDTQGRIGQELLVRKTQNDLLNDETERGYKAAQTARALREPVTRDMRVGNRILRQNPDGTYTPVYDAPEKPTERRPLLRSVTAPDGSTRTLKSTDNGATWEQVPELQGAPKPEPDVSFGNSQIERNISEAVSEKKKIADALANTAEFIETPGPYSNGLPTKHPNPIHQSLKSRERELDDQIRRWRADMKAPKAPVLNRSTPSRGRGRNYVAPRVSSQRLQELMK